MALLAIVLIILLIVLLMLFYRFGPALRIGKTPAAIFAGADHRSREFAWVPRNPGGAADANERRAGADRRSLLIARGQIGGYRDRRHHGGRRQEDQLWIRY
jgi:hypothetical protein